MKNFCKKNLYELGNVICHYGNEYEFYYYFSNDESYISIETEIGCITISIK